MPLIILLSLILSLVGCAYVPIAKSAWTDEDFSRASNPEMVEIAAACLQHMFSSQRTRKDDHLYYLSVQDADWRAVIERAGLPELKSRVFGFRDYFWSQDGYRDRESGLRVFTLSISLDGKITPEGKTHVYILFGVGTNRAGSGDVYTLEKQHGRWTVVKFENLWIS